MSKKPYEKPEAVLIDKPSYDELVNMLDKSNRTLNEYKKEVKKAHKAIKESNEALLTSIKNTDTANDKYVRALADYQNLQRISSERIANSKNDGKISIIKQLLPIMDNFERAKESGEVSEGIELVYNLLVNMLKNNDVTEINPKAWDNFDDTVHEAVASIPGSDDTKNTIAFVQQKGYKVGDKVIRYAKVGVYVN